MDAEGNAIAPNEHAHSFGHFIAWKQLKQKLKAEPVEIDTQFSQTPDKPPLMPTRNHVAHNVRLRDVWANGKDASRERAKDRRLLDVSVMVERREFRGSKPSATPLGLKRARGHSSRTRHPNVHDHVIQGQSSIDMLLNAPRSLSRPSTSMSTMGQNTMNLRRSF